MNSFSWSSRQVGEEWSGVRAHSAQQPTSIRMSTHMRITARLRPGTAGPAVDDHHERPGDHDRRHEAGDDHADERPHHVEDPADQQGEVENPAACMGTAYAGARR